MNAFVLEKPQCQPIYLIIEKGKCRSDSDMSEINVDESLIKNDVAVNHKEEKLVEMSNAWLSFTSGSI